MAQQLPPAGQVGGQRAEQSDQQRLEQAHRREAQQVNGVGPIEIGQRLGQLPHQRQRQQAAEQHPEQGAHRGEYHELQDEPTQHPTRPHPQNDQLGQLGAAHALDKALGVEHQKQSHRHGEQ